MKKIQVLGTGCPKCSQLAERTEQAARELDLQYELVKVSSVGEITSFGVMNTPALAVDGKVVLAGRVPTVEEIKSLIA